MHLEDQRSYLAYHLPRSRTALESFQTAHIKHIYREANRCADFLAKRGATSEQEFSLLNDLPLELSRLIEEDCRCFCLPRIVNLT